MKILKEFVQKTVKEYFKSIEEDYSSIDKSNPYKILDDYYIKDEYKNSYADGEDNYRAEISSKENKNIPLGRVLYSVKDGKVFISYIQSNEKGKGYGQILMIYLAKKYGYENLERTNLTVDGKKMRERLDNLFDFDYNEFKKSPSKHYDKDIIDRIAEKNPIAAQYLNNLVSYGKQRTDEVWEDYIKSENLDKTYNFQDLYEISQWIIDSKTNNNSPDKNPPSNIKNKIYNFY
jgi:hypothetical protein